MKQFCYGDEEIHGQTPVVPLSCHICHLLPFIKHISLMHDDFDTIFLVENMENVCYLSVPVG